MFTIEQIRNFENLQVFVLSSSQNSIGFQVTDDHCYQVPHPQSGYSDSNNCNFGNGFCCHEKYQIDLHESLDGNAWTECDDKNSGNLCSCSNRFTCENSRLTGM